MRRAFLAILLGLLAIAASPASASDAPPPSGLSQQAMIAMVTLPPAAFVAQWNARRAAAEAARGTDHARDNDIRWQWAAGLIDYPYFHQRETGRAVPAHWAPRQQALAQIGFRDGTALDSPAYRQLLDAWLHDRAGSLLSHKATLKTGDNRWLRARFMAILAQPADQRIRLHLMRQVLVTHVDDNGARHIEPQLRAFANAGGAAADLANLRAALAEETAPPTDHTAFAYRRFDGVDLYAHVFTPPSPPAGKQQPRPALLWFHGGSLDSGNWRHCPLVCRYMQSLGFVVIQVEYRTSQRFDGTPLDALSDARAVVRWARNNATRLGLDPARMMTAGFSSGGLLAAQLAVLPNRQVHGGAFISACYNPAGDKWYRGKVAPLVDPATLSPLLRLDASAPPMIMFHVSDDEMCPFADAVAMETRARAVGADAQLVPMGSGGHFFIFGSAPARDQIKARLSDYVQRLGWLTGH